MTKEAGYELARNFRKLAAFRFAEPVPAVESAGVYRLTARTVSAPAGLGTQPGWLPYMVSQRQARGMEPIRYHFQPAGHEALAQEAGHYTFHLDPAGGFWSAEGQKETQYPAFCLDASPASDRNALREICQTGLHSSRTIALRLTTIADQVILPGSYQLHFLFVCPSSAPAGNRILDLVLPEAEGTSDVTRRIDVLRQAGGKDRALEVTLPVNIRGVSLAFRLEPVKGSNYVCAIIVEPRE